MLSRINAAEAGLIVAATIRTDRYEAMQNHPALAGRRHRVVRRAQTDAADPVRHVITGPAARAGEDGQRLSIAPDLVTRLLADAAEGADTLPLLALTLARLYTDYARTGELTLANYEAMGGMRSVVQTDGRRILATDADAARAATGAAALGVHPVAGHHQPRQRPTDAPGRPVRPICPSRAAP